jgi:hypothetical protein
MQAQRSVGRRLLIIKKGTEVEVVASDDQTTEIVYKKKHRFADQGIF